MLFLRGRRKFWRQMINNGGLIVREKGRAFWIRGFIIWIKSLGQGKRVLGRRVWMGRGNKGKIRGCSALIQGIQGDGAQNIVHNRILVSITKSFQISD